MSKKKLILDGLKDGKKGELRCSMCDSHLLSYWVTQPDKAKLTRLQATCPYCPLRNDGSRQTSYIHEISGGFHLGPAFIEVNPETGDDIQLTTWTNFEEIDGKTIITVERRNNGN